MSHTITICGSMYWVEYVKIFEPDVIRLKLAAECDEGFDEIWESDEFEELRDSFDFAEDGYFYNPENIEVSVDGVRIDFDIPDFKSSDVSHGDRFDGYYLISEESADPAWVSLEIDSEFDMSKLSISCKEFDLPSGETIRLIHFLYDGMDFEYEESMPNNQSRYIFNTADSSIFYL